MLQNIVEFIIFIALRLLGWTFQNSSDDHGLDLTNFSLTFEYFFFFEAVYECVLNAFACHKFVENCSYVLFYIILTNPHSLIMLLRKQLRLRAK